MSNGTAAQIYACLQGYSEGSLGNYSKSIDIANQILNHDPTNLDALELKAMSLIYLGKNNTALTILNTLISEGHVVPWVLDDRGVALLNLKNYVGAIANFDNALTLEPIDAYAFFNRAIAVLNLDLYSQQIYSLQQLQATWMFHNGNIITD